MKRLVGCAVFGAVSGIALVAGAGYALLWWGPDLPEGWA